MTVVLNAPFSYTHIPDVPMPSPGVPPVEVPTAGVSKIRFHFGSMVTAGTFEGGQSIWVLLPPGQSVTVQGIETQFPGSAAWTTDVGAELNPNNPTRQGYYCPTASSPRCDMSKRVSFPLSVTGINGQIQSLLVAAHFPGSRGFIARQNSYGTNYRYVERFTSISFVTAVPPAGALRPPLVGPPSAKQLFDVDTFDISKITTTRANLVASDDRDTLLRDTCRSEDPDYSNSIAGGQELRPGPLVYGAYMASARMKLAEFAINPNTEPVFRRKALVCLLQFGQDIAWNIMHAGQAYMETGGQGHSRLAQFAQFAAATQIPAIKEAVRDWSRPRANMNALNHPTIFYCANNNCPVDRAFAEAGFLFNVPGTVMSSQPGGLPQIPIQTWYGGPYDWDLPPTPVQYDGGFGYNYGSYFHTVNSAIGALANFARALPQPESVRSLIDPRLLGYACRYAAYGIHNPGHPSHGQTVYDGQIDSRLTNALRDSCRADYLSGIIAAP